MWGVIDTSFLSHFFPFKPRVKANTNSPLGLNSSTEVLYMKQIWNILSSTPSNLNQDKAKLKFLINSLIVGLFRFRLSYYSNLLAFFGICVPSNKSNPHMIIWF